jgi:hypothetical protein
VSRWTQRDIGCPLSIGRYKLHHSFQYSWCRTSNYREMCIGGDSRLVCCGREQVSDIDERISEVGGEVGEQICGDLGLIQQVEIDVVNESASLRRLKRNIVGRLLSVAPATLGNSMGVSYSIVK